MFEFFVKFGVLCFLVTSVLRFALLPYYRRNPFYPTGFLMFSGGIGRDQLHEMG